MVLCCEELVRRRRTEWVLRRETERRNSSTAKMHSIEADNHRLSDQTLSNLWYARVHRMRTVWKGRLVDPVGQALRGSNSRRGSRILEGPG